MPDVNKKKMPPNFRQKTRQGAKRGGGSDDDDFLQNKNEAERDLISQFKRESKKLSQGSQGDQRKYQ